MLEGTRPQSEVCPNCMIVNKFEENVREIHKNDHVGMQLPRPPLCVMNKKKVLGRLFIKHKELFGDQTHTASTLASDYELQI